MDKFVAIVLTSLTIKITQYFSCLESLKKDEKETLSHLDKFVAIFLMSLTTRITWSFSCLESLKRDEKETQKVLFCRLISQV